MRLVRSSFFPGVELYPHILSSWFLDNPDLDWTPPESLLDFMQTARDDGKPLVYIGFGSITVPDPHTMTEHIYQAVQKSGYWLQQVQIKF